MRVAAGQDLAVSPSALRAISPRMISLVPPPIVSRHRLTPQELELEPRTSASGAPSSVGQAGDALADLAAPQLVRRRLDHRRPAVLDGLQQLQRERLDLGDLDGQIGKAVRARPDPRRDPMPRTHATSSSKSRTHPARCELDVALGRQRVDDQLPRSVLVADAVGDRHLDTVEAGPR